MSKPAQLYFQDYKELFNYCYSMVKINEEAIIQLVDYDFKENFQQDDLNQWINDRRNSIFYQNSDFFDISLKRSELSNFRHGYSNYEEVLNQLTTEKVESITSLRSICLKDLLYYNDYAHQYNIRIKDEDNLHLSLYKNLPIIKAIYYDLKTAITNRINIICTLRIDEKYQILKAKRLNKLQEQEKAKVEQKRRLEEANKLQKDITNIEKELSKKYISLTLNTMNPSYLQKEAESSLINAIILGLVCPTSWLSLMFFAALITAPNEDWLRNFLIFITGIILGLPYLIPLVRCFIFKYLYLEQKSVYLSKLQEYKKSCHVLLKEYDTLVNKFISKYKKSPNYNREYILREIEHKIKYYTDHH